MFQVARCQSGSTGLVTHKRGWSPVHYMGVCLDPGHAGKPWQSDNPEWIGTLDDWVTIRHAEILEEEIATEGVS